jgi:hypothetical protein
MSSFLNLVPAQCQAMTVSAMAVVAVRSVTGFVRLAGAGDTHLRSALHRNTTAAPLSLGVAFSLHQRLIWNTVARTNGDA